uniref:Uncharacterized protein n=1 Tax=Brugia timori TaxID=42155 RepID=A0A0R3R2G5_9BILA
MNQTTNLYSLLTKSKYILYTMEIYIYKYKRNYSSSSSSSPCGRIVISRTVAFAIAPSKTFNKAIL